MRKYLIFALLLLGVCGEPMLCALCNSLVTTVHNFFARQSSYSPLTLDFDYLKPLFTLLCNFQHKYEACLESVEIYAPLFTEFRYIFNSTVVCSYLLMCVRHEYVVDSDVEFAKRVLRDKPPVYRRSPLSSSKPITILAFSDAHIDPDYEEVRQGGNGREEARTATGRCAAEQEWPKEKRRRTKQESTGRTSATCP